jgi:hypothetical protein
MAAKLLRGGLALLALCGLLPARAAELSALETRWLQGALPVLQHAKAAGLPLDIVVQPQPAAGLPPLALAFVDGRCKLVLSMRGNPMAERTLEALEPALRDGALELMAAHELGHCLRHLSGRWHAHPRGAAPVFPAALPAERRDDHAQMQATRLEEGYGDLAGLAWIAHARPASYAPLYRWLLRERSAGLLPGSHHDTLAWLRLVEQPATLAGATPFERVHELWLLGLPQVASSADNSGSPTGLSR